MKKVFPIILPLLALSLFSPCSDARADKPKNIIMIVADGMGPSFTTAYRNFHDDPRTSQIEPVIFDRIFTGNVSTYPANESGYVTDSTAAATAMATGIKTYNGAIGVDINKNNVVSVLQYAKSQGLRTGVAVTSQINHATPAAYIAHNVSRQNYNELADSYFDDRIDGAHVADVMLGGGTDYFIREDRNLLEEFESDGYVSVTDYSDLKDIAAKSNVIGLFGEVGLPYAIDDNTPFRLKLLTEQAIRLLDNEQGYFLLVEASQVDWAAHKNDIAAAMREMDDLAATLEYLYAYVSENSETLVIVTADHNTGGLSIGANDLYEWNPAALKQISASPAVIAEQMMQEQKPIAFVEKILGFAVPEDQLPEPGALAIMSLDEREDWVKKLVDIQTNTGWTTRAHTGVDVELFSFGANHTDFTGQLDNTDIPKKIFSYLKSANEKAQ